jgi:predicted component of type VI protein secretion system
MVVRFHVVLPAANQRTLTVRLPILLGRGEEAKFRIQHDLVSRRHCEFFEHSGRLYLRDLGSTNGTFLDEQQVPPRTQTVVVPGATVRVGGLSFTVDYKPVPTDDSTDVIDAQCAPGAVAVDESRDESRVGADDGAVSEQPEQKQPEPKQPEPKQAEPKQAEDEQAEHGQPEPEQLDFKTPDSDEAIGWPEQVIASPGEVERGPEQESALAEPSQPVEGFDFLNAGDAATQPSGTPEWPFPADAAADEPPDDDQLNAFFQGLK